MLARQLVLLLSDVRQITISSNLELHDVMELRLPTNHWASLAQNSGASWLPKAICLLQMQIRIGYRPLIQMPLARRRRLCWH